MRRLRGPALGLLVAGIPALSSAQQDRAVKFNRAAAIGFGSAVVDARALWINPAALGLVPLASVIADVSLVGPFDDRFQYVGQWTFGWSSRGLSAGYQHDRFVVGGERVGVRDTYRVGYGRGVGRTAAGVAATLYRGNGRGFALDLGVVHALTSAIQASLVIANIGEPTVGPSKLPTTFLPSATMTLPGGSVAFSTGGRLARDSLHVWSAAVAYRAPARLPLSVQVRFDGPFQGSLEDDSRLTFSVTLGGAGAVQAALTTDPKLQFSDLMSVTGIAIRPLTQGRRPR